MGEPNVQKDASGSCISSEAPAIVLRPQKFPRTNYQPHMSLLVRHNVKSNPDYIPPQVVYSCFPHLQNICFCPWLADRNRGGESTNGICFNCSFLLSFFFKLGKNNTIALLQKTSLGFHSVLFLSPQFSEFPFLFYTRVGSQKQTASQGKGAIH